VSSGERKRKRLNLAHVIPVRGCVWGVVGATVQGLTFLALCRMARGTVWDGRPEWVRVPYAKAVLVWCGGVPSSSELVEFAVNLPGPPGKPKYFLMTDSGQVP
jgi:hypothetical protein